MIARHVGRILLTVCAVSFAALTNANSNPLEKPALTEQEITEGSKAEGGKLVWYTSFPEDTAKLLINEFKTKYPWVDVTFIRKGGVVLAQQFNAEKEAKVEKVDVINAGAAEAYPAWRRKGYLASISNVPGFAELRPVAKGPEGHYASYLFISAPTFWNTKLIQEKDVPNDLRDYTKPEWKGRIATGNPTTGAAAQNWYSWVSETRPQSPGDSLPPSGLGWDWISGVRANDILLPGQVGPLNEAIISGQAPVGVSQYFPSIAEAIRKGAPVDYKYPVQGSIAQHWILAVNANAPNPYTARLFTLWNLSADAQKLFVKEVGAHAGRSDVKTEDHFPFARGTLPFEKLWKLDIEAITPDDTKQFVDKLTTVLVSKSTN